jgi:ATP-dependent helicase/nuclease subunit A
MSGINFDKIFLNPDGSFKDQVSVAESLLLIKDINQSYAVKLEMIGWLKNKGHETSFLPEIRAIYDHARDISGIGAGREIREEDFLILMERCDIENLSPKFKKPNFRNYKKSLLKLMNYAGTGGNELSDRKILNDLEKNGLYPEILSEIKKYINSQKFYFKGEIYDKAIQAVNRKNGKNVFVLNLYEGETSAKEKDFIGSLDAVKLNFRPEGKFADGLFPEDVEFFVSKSKLDEAEKVKHLILDKVCSDEYGLDDFTVLCPDEEMFGIVNNLFHSEKIPAYSSYKHAMNDISTDILRLFIAGIESDAQSIMNFFNLYISEEPVKSPDLTETDIKTLFAKLKAKNSDLKLKTTDPAKKEKDDTIKKFIGLIDIEDKELSPSAAISAISYLMKDLNNIIKKNIDYDVYSYKEQLDKIFGESKRKFSEYIEYLYLISSKSNREKLNKDMSGVRINMLNEPAFGGKYLILTGMTEGNFLKASNPVGIISKDNYFSMYKNIYGVDPEEALYENFRIISSGRIEKAAVFVPLWGEETIPSIEIDKILGKYPKKTLNIEVIPRGKGPAGISGKFSTTLNDLLEDGSFGKLETSEKTARPAANKFCIELKNGKIEEHLVSASKVESFLSCPASHVHDLNLKYDEIESQFPFTKGNFFHKTTEIFLKYYTGKDLLTEAEYDSVVASLSGGKGKEKMAATRYSEFSEYFWSGFANEKYDGDYEKIASKIKSSGAGSEIEEYVNLQSENNPYGYYAYEKQKYEIAAFIFRLIIEMGPTPSKVTESIRTEVKFCDFIVTEDPGMVIKRGYIDLMFIDHNGTVRILDIKTNTKFEQFEDEIKEYQKVQILIYREAVSRRLKGSYGVNFDVERDSNHPGDKDCSILEAGYFDKTESSAQITADYVSPNKPFILSSEEQNFTNLQSVLNERMNDRKRFFSKANSGCEYCALGSSCPDNGQSKFEEFKDHKISSDSGKQCVVYTCEKSESKAGGRSKKFIIFEGEKAKALTLDKNIIISAGAGAGKTEVLSSKYISLLINSDATADNIVCITFTKKAAGEMQKRIYSKLCDVIESGYFIATDKGADPSAYRPDENKLAKLKVVRDDFFEKNLISTFHSFCNRFIADYGYSSEALKGYDLAQNLSEDYKAGDECVKFLKKEFDNRFKNILTGRISDMEYDVFYGWLKSRHLIYSGDFEGGFIPDILNLYAEMKLSGKELEISDWIGSMEDYLEHVEERFILSAPGYMDLREKALDAIDEQIALTNGSAAEKLSELREKIGKNKKFAYKAVAKKFPEVLNAAEALYESEGYKIINEKSVELSLNGEEYAVKKAVFEIIKALDSHISKFKAEKGMIEQNDLHLHFLEMLKDGIVKSELQNRFTHILVDEFQDTNWLQEKILEELKTKDNRYFLVGDRKQSIYRFQQCDVQIFEKYLNKFTPLYFSDNYRSSPGIVNFNNDVFSQNAANGYDIIKSDSEMSKTPVGKENKYSVSVNFVNINCTATKERIKSDDSCTLTGTQTGKISKMSEAAFVTDTILESCKEKKNYGDWAVLIRKYTHIGYITEAFRKKKIPYTLILKRDLFALNEVAEFVAILKTAMRVLKPAEIEFIPGYEILLSEILKTDPLISVIFRIFSHKIYRDYLASFQDCETRLSNVAILLENLIALLNESENDRERFLSALDRSVKNNSAGVVVQNPDAVTVMTVHSSKGLEFENLILANVDEYDKNQSAIFNYINLWEGEKNNIDFSMSGYKSAAGFEARNFFLNEYIKYKNRNFDAAERANLLYVALTRAKNSLTVVIQTKNESDDSYDSEKSSGWAKYLNQFGQEKNGITDGFFYTQKDISEFDLSTYYKATEEDSGTYQAEKKYDLTGYVRTKNLTSPTGIAHKDDDVTHEKGSTTAIDTGNMIHDFMCRNSANVFASSYQLEEELKMFIDKHADSRGLNLKTIRKMIENIISVADFKEMILTRKQLCEKNISDFSGGKMIQGYIDLVLIGDNEVAVIDYKTYLKNFPDNETVAKYEQQVNIYASALSKLYPDKTVKKYLFFIGKDKAELSRV